MKNFCARRIGRVSAQASRRLHHPQTPQNLAPEEKFVARLAFDELLSHQLALRLVRRKMQVLRGRAQKSEGALAAKILAASCPST